MFKISNLKNIPSYFYSFHFKPLLKFHWDSNPILQFNHNLDQVRYTQTKYSLPENEIYNLPKDFVRDHRIARAFAHCSNWDKEGQFLLKLKQLGQIEIRKAKDKFNNLRANWTQLVFPLKDNLALRQLFCIQGNVRIGRILEIGDYLAELISYEYAGNSNYNPELGHFVTVCMDNFRLFSSISASEDLVIEGYPTFTGKTTVEIRIDILQEGQLKGTSRFLMASRKHGAKGSQIPELEFNQEEQQEKCLLRKQFGELHQIVRKKNQNLALDKFPPTEAESKEIHETFLQSLKQPQKYKHMKDSFLENNILLHVEDKNIHQNAFGGLIMRNGLDLALLSAFRHCPHGDFPLTVHISDVLFIAPIQINQIVNFKSSVTYVHSKSNLVNVFVGVNTISSKQGIKKETRATELNFTFYCKNKNGKMLQIVPENYEEAMKFLESKRKLLAFL